MFWNLYSVKLTLGKKFVDRLVLNHYIGSSEQAGFATEH